MLLTKALNYSLELGFCRHRIYPWQYWICRLNKLPVFQLCETVSVKVPGRALTDQCWHWQVVTYLSPYT